MKYVLMLCCLIQFPVMGQYMQHISEINDTIARSCFVQYENDLFTQTDRYYTQGVFVGYRTPVQHSPKWTSLFFKVPNSYKAAHFTFGQCVFTPTSIRSDSLLDHDRPYAATMRLNSLFERIDTVKKRMVGWELSLGMIGPGALGNQTQTGIHRLTNNALPLGWHHQIATGLLADVSLLFQQRIISIQQWGYANVASMATIGTGNMNYQLGLHTGIVLSNAKVGITFYAKPTVRLVGYDATLQGSLLGKQSEYVLSSAQLNRTVFEQEFGIQFRWKQLAVTAQFHYQSALFKDAQNHRWGGIRMSYVFRN